jgi:hypothetical protein
MKEHEALAHKFIDLISDYVMAEYDIESKERLDDGRHQAEDPVLIFRIGFVGDEPRIILQATS